ncbi:short-chain fatty acyl-CoA regulator family protein [Solirhodobacter olei]|uniref:short-chain fatty acyl-CoA regulator family protein n=1 Tax=Solirhodobacter olei TaxID=2493082 RepID=UPI000FDBEDD9|nr:short-chain fatty acyl-CoA regulator family protein [Solirhodobacter olei]
MPRSALTGSRIRERRGLAGMKQADLARAVGVSASYLNLIEHNRRRVGEDLLARIARALGVEVQALAEGAEAALLDGLRDAAALGGAEPAPELERVEEFVGRFPGWAALLAARHGRVALLERTVAALSDRMAHDPHLSASLHEVLSALTGVRSAAAILAETEDLEPEWQARFQANLGADADRLARGAEALVAYLDGPAGQETAVASPREEVEAWFAAQAYHLEAVEAGGAPAGARLVAEGFGAGAARKLAEVAVARYAADAAALPLAAFRGAVAQAGGDPGAVATATGAELAMVLRRMAALPELGAGLVICDGSGAVTFRKPAEGFAMPRFGAGCPLWPLYQALGRPMIPLRARLEMAGRQARRFLAYAICRPRGPAGFDAPQVSEAVMLIVPDDGPGAAEAVGATCRICPREACPARREPSILAEAV